MFVMIFVKAVLMYAHIEEISYLLSWSELDMCKAVMRLFHKDCSFKMYSCPKARKYQCFP